MVSSLILLGGILLGQNTAAEPSTGLEVRRLVRQLDAPRLDQRDEAEQRLIELGPKILDLLPTPDDRASAEVRQRLGRVRQKLQRGLAASVIQGSRVTLSGDGLPIGKILAAFQEQTQNRFADERLVPPQAPGPTLSVDFHDTLFWQALDEVLDKAGLTIDPYAAQGVIQLRPRAEGQRLRREAASYSGPFRFEPIRIEAIRDLRNPASQSLRLTVEVSWEPRLAPITFQQRMADIRAVDAAGNPMAVDGRQAQLEVPIRPDTMAVPLVIPLVLPGRDVTQIGRLEGSLTALVPGKVETFRFEDLEDAKDVEKRVAGVTVVLDRVRKNNSIWDVGVHVRFDNAEDALASHRNWIFDNEAYLENPQGERVAYDAFETTRQTENEVGVAYLFAVDGPLTGYKFVYKTPGLILSRTIDYQVQDIPLP